MSNPIPNELALTDIPDGSEADAAPLRNNFNAIMAAVNLLRACLAGGSAGQKLRAVDGTDVEWAPGLPTRTVITAVGAGTYTTPAGCKEIFVECVGGGGGAGGTAAGAPAQLTLAGAGGGGGYASARIANPAGTYPVTVGVGGTAGGGGANNGNSGGTTSFGTGPLVSAAGGGGGNGAPNGIAGAATDGGTGVAGDILVAGGDSQVSRTNGLEGGQGGAAAGPYGGGRRRGPANTAVNASANGFAGHAYGGGGSGGVTVEAGGTTTGGAGAQGLIVVTEYY